MKRYALFAILAAIAVAAPPVVVQNGTILTVTKGTIKNGSILIRDGKIAEVGEAAHRDRRAAPVLHRFHASLEVEADGFVGGEGFQQRGLAHTGRAENGERGLVLGGREAFVGGDDAEGHGVLRMISRGAAAGVTGCRRGTCPALPLGRPAAARHRSRVSSRNTGLPVVSDRAAAKPSRMASGQAPKRRSGTR